MAAALMATAIKTHRLRLCAVSVEHGTRRTRSGAALTAKRKRTVVPRSATAATRPLLALDSATTSMLEHVTVIILTAPAVSLTL